MAALEVIVVAIWVMLPAYIPNNVAVLAGGGRPIDGGRTIRGRRLLGDGKTWRGTAVGVLAGVVLAGLLDALNSTAAATLGVALPTFPPGATIGLPAGAMAGDIAASFLKRRTGRERGASFPVVDQLDFVVVALLLTAILAWEWVLATFSLPILVAIVVLTPLLHVGTNVLAYLLGLKHEPW